MKGSFPIDVGMDGKVTHSRFQLDVLSVAKLDFKLHALRLMYNPTREKNIDAGIG